MSKLAMVMPPPKPSFHQATTVFFNFRHRPKQTELARRSQRDCQQHKRAQPLQREQPMIVPGHARNKTDRADDQGAVYVSEKKIAPGPGRLAKTISIRQEAQADSEDHHDGDSQQLHVTVRNIESRQVEQQLLAAAGQLEQFEDDRICDRCDDKPNKSGIAAREGTIKCATVCKAMPPTISGSEAKASVGRQRVVCLNRGNI